MTRATPDSTLDRLAAVLERLESLLPAQSPTDFSSSLAFRWRKRRYLGIEQGELQPVLRPALIPFDDLKHVDAQKAGACAKHRTFRARVTGQQRAC